MSVMVIYKNASDHARVVEEFLHNFEQRTSVQLETIDPESKHGVDVCQLYDVVEYPSIVATTENGVLRKLWRGVPLPLIDEVRYYV